jgi:hypothetical protein
MIYILNALFAWIMHSMYLGLMCAHIGFVKLASKYGQNIKMNVLIAEGDLII